MKQKFIQLSNIKLAYLDKNETQKNIIFFIHGNSVSSLSWKAQLNSSKLDNYRLIAIDLPAHGDSEGSEYPETDYSIPGLAAIVASAIKAIAGSNPFIMVGLSLGTNILAESLAFGLHPQGVVLAGSCLVGENYTLDSFAYPDTNIHVVFVEQATENEVRKYAAEVMTNDNATIVNEFIADYNNVKLPFRSVLTNSIQLQQFNDQIKLVASINKPLLMIFGKDEQIINPHYLDNAPLNLWNDIIYKIPAAGHLVHSDQPDEFNSLLAAYADVSL